MLFQAGITAFAVNKDAILSQTDPTLLLNFFKDPNVTAWSDLFQAQFDYFSNVITREEIEELRIVCQHIDSPQQTKKHGEEDGFVILENRSRSNSSHIQRRYLFTFPTDVSPTSLVRKIADHFHINKGSRPGSRIG